MITINKKLPSTMKLTRYYNIVITKIFIQFFKTCNIVNCKNNIRYSFKFNNDLIFVVNLC